MYERYLARYPIQNESSRNTCRENMGGSERGRKPFVSLGFQKLMILKTLSKPLQGL